jgi:hypothetical protein
MAALNQDFTIEQGSTFKVVLRWENPDHLLYHTIESITNGAPAVLTVPGHSVPDGWPVVITGASGMKKINAQNDPLRNSDFHTATVLSPSTIELNDVDATDMGTYVTDSGQLRYYAPVDITGYTARMQARANVSSEDILLDLSSGGGEIVVDSTAKTITVTIEAADTAALEWKAAVYDLEMVAADGAVTRLLQGGLTVVPEVTR